MQINARSHEDSKLAERMKLWVVARRQKGCRERQKNIATIYTDDKQRKGVTFLYAASRFPPNTLSRFLSFPCLYSYLERNTPRMIINFAESN